MAFAERGESFFYLFVAHRRRFNDSLLVELLEAIMPIQPAKETNNLLSGINVKLNLLIAAHFMDGIFTHCFDIEINFGGR